MEDIPQRACFTEAPIEITTIKPEEAGMSHIPAKYLVTSAGYDHQKYKDFLIARLGLEDVEPDAPRIGLITRRGKRFILNEEEIAISLMSTGVQVVLLPLEDMTLYEQVKEIRKVTILIGIHGSGLINSIFQVEDSYIVQLLPFNVKYGAAFFQGTAESSRVKYTEYQNKKSENTVLHWHFLNDESRSAYNDEACGPDSPGKYFFLCFFLFVQIFSHFALIKILELM